MTLQELGSLGEFISSLGVMITLIYLIVEIRRNTQAALDTSRQRSFERFSSARTLIASTPQLAASVEKACANEELTPGEVRQVRSYFNEFGFCVLYFLNSDEAANGEAAKLASDTFDFYVSMLDNDIGRQFIAEEPFPTSFRDAVLSKLAEHEVQAAQAKSDAA